MTNGSSYEETIGLDLSDETGLLVVIDAAGGVVREGKVALTLAGVRQVFGARTACRIAIEVGTHSPWLRRELERLGYEVIRGQRSPGGADCPRPEEDGPGGRGDPGAGSAVRPAAAQANPASR